MTKPAGLILFHGAGGDRDHHLFLSLEDHLGVPVERVNFPYRDKGPGRRPPDRMPKLVSAINEAVDAAEQRWGIDRRAIVLGGRSMGGRAASVAIAEGLEAAGLLLLSYPLHPAGKPEKLRVDHFGQVECPVLLIQGQRDPLGRPEEFATHLPSLTGPLTEHWIDANHSPKPAFDAEICAEVSKWWDELGA